MQLAFPMLLNGQCAEDGSATGGGQGMAGLKVLLQQPGCRPLQLDI